MALIAYWIAHATSGWTGTPTGAQIAAGNQSDNSAATFSGTESGFATTGTIQIDEATAITTASAGTSYTQAWTVYDDVATTYSTPAVGTVTTAASVSLAATGATGAFSATASSPATATLAATGGTGAFIGEAGETLTVTLSKFAAISITATSVQPQIHYDIAGTPSGGTTYFAVYPNGTNPTWTRGGANDGWSGTPTAYGQDTSPPTTTTTDDEPTITWSSALTPGTSYRLWAIWDDGSTSSNSGATHGTTAFTTRPLAVLDTTGATGAFSGSASSPTVATLATTGGTGAFSATASSPATATLAETGGSGTFAGSAGSGTSAALAATGASGAFVGSAASTTTVALAVTGGAGTFSGVAYTPAIATLAATGGTGVFSGIATTVGTATLNATGSTGTFSGAANSTTTVSLAATGGSGTFGGEAVGYVAPTAPPVSGGGLSNRSGAYPAGTKRAPYDLLNNEPRRRDEEDLRALARKRLIEDDETIMALLRGVMQSGIFEEDTV